jgi:elongation factor P
MSIPITQVRPGITFEMDGKIFRCVVYDHIKWAQQARIRIKMKDLRSGALYERTFNVGETVEPAHIERKKMQFLYSDEDQCHFMEQETFEQIAIPKAKVGDSLKFIKEGFNVDIIFYGDEPLDIELPSSIELKVVEAPPSFKGNTASGGTKPVTTETGLIVNVPFFIEKGEMLKIDTRDGSYLSRA